MAQRIALNNENLRRLLESLRQFAAEYGARGRANFLLFGDMLLHEAHLGRDAGLLPQILRRHGKLIRFDLPFMAERITVRTNARIFGFKGGGQKPLTVKILMRHSGKTFAERLYGNSLFADIRARRLAAAAFARSPVLTVPGIVAYDKKHGRWLVEEHVPGVSAGRHDLGRVAPFIDFPALYAGAARLRPFARRRQSGRMSAWLREIDPGFPIPDDDALWPEALVHSDMGNAGNVLAAPDGRLCLIDWELAHVAPVAIDLGSLYWRNPDLKPLLMRWLSALDPEGKAMAPNVQLAYGLVRHANQMFRDPSGFVTGLMEGRGLDHAAARRQFAEDKAGLAEFLAFLRKA